MWYYFCHLDSELKAIKEKLDQMTTSSDLPIRQEISEKSNAQIAELTLTIVQNEADIKRMRSDLESLVQLLDEKDKIKEVDEQHINLLRSEVESLADITDQKDQEIEDLKANLIHCQDGYQNLVKELEGKDHQIKLLESKIQGLKNLIPEEEIQFINPTLPFLYIITHVENDKFISLIEKRLKRSMNIIVTNFSEFQQEIESNDSSETKRLTIYLYKHPLNDADKNRLTYLNDKEESYILCQIKTKEREVNDTLEFIKREIPIQQFHLIDLTVAKQEQVEFQVKRLVKKVIKLLQPVR